MTDPKRYRLGYFDDERCKLYDHPEGEFVTHDDYAALRRLASSDGGAKVRELEWVEREGVTGTFDANTSIGHYIATITDDDRGMWFIVGQTMGAYMLPDIDVVKAAAQADYERRILSALEAPAAGDGAAAAMREALEDCQTHHDAWRSAITAMFAQGDPDELYWQHELNAFDRTFKALTAPGATTKSDGGGRARDFSTVAIDENFYFTWPKDGASEVQVQDSGGTKGKSNAAPVASVDANANDDGQRVQTGNNVVTGGESATTNSSPSEPKNYFFENEEDAAEAADNGRNTGGKSYYRPSEPSSTSSEVTVGDFAGWCESNGYFPSVSFTRALLDQFEIRRKK